MLDDERLKNPGQGRDYFDELTRRLQDIRTSERRFYQKITDIYAASVDYAARQVLDDQRFESDFDRMVKQLPTRKPGDED